MQLENFIKQRIKETEGKISESNISILRLKLKSVETFVDCKSCAFFNAGRCEESGAYEIPEIIIPFGCDKAKLDVPF